MDSTKCTTQTRLKQPTPAPDQLLRLRWCPAAGKKLGAGAGGMTLIVIAYRMSTIALADEIVYLERGRLVDRGRHDALMARCRGYHDLVTAYAREAADRADRAARDRAGAGKRHTTGAGTGGRR